MYRGDQIVSLAPKAFALLQFLAGQTGRFVSKQELLSAIWPGVFVGDAVLKSTIRELRKALATTRISPASSKPLIAAAIASWRRSRRSNRPAQRPPSHPRVSYARSGSVNIAYQVIGSGPIDLVFVMGWVSHLEYFWNEPSFARFLTRLSSMARLILFDKRGTGLSDPVPVSELPSLDTAPRRCARGDGCGRQSPRGSDGRLGRRPVVQPVCRDLSREDRRAHHDWQLRAAAGDTDYPWGPTLEEHERFCETIIAEWGGPVGLEERAPSVADDGAFREWWAAYLRMGASPGAAVALTRMNAEIDIRDVLPTIRVPALVIHRTGDRCLKVEEGRYLASRIPGATFVELPGIDHLPFVGDQDALLSAVEDFLSRRQAPRPRQRRLRPRSASSRMALRTILICCGGSLITNASSFAAGEMPPVADRFAATFDGPGRAVQCALSVIAIAQQSRIDARAGVHIGEFDVNCSDTPLVIAATAIASAAGDHGVSASRTVVDLLAGSGLTFENRRRVELEGGRPLTVLSVTPSR